MMKIGDMVKFNEVLTGLGNCLGIVIDYNGDGIVDVHWTDKHAARAVEIDVRNGTSSELVEFLEVVSKA
jgi:hypothetical protein